MENENTSFNGFVLVPRDKYDDLICARFGIDVIGSSFSSYGMPNDEVVKNVCRQFGFKFKEAADA